MLPIQQDPRAACMQFPSGASPCGFPGLLPPGGGAQQGGLFSAAPQGVPRMSPHHMPLQPSPLASPAYPPLHPASLQPQPMLMMGQPGPGHIMPGRAPFHPHPYQVYGGGMMMMNSGSLQPHPMYMRAQPASHMMPYHVNAPSPYGDFCKEGFRMGYYSSGVHPVGPPLATVPLQGFIP